MIHGRVNPNQPGASSAGRAEAEMGRVRVKTHTQFGRTQRTLSDDVGIRFIEKNARSGEVICAQGRRSENNRETPVQRHRRVAKRFRRRVLVYHWDSSRRRRSCRTITTQARRHRHTGSLADRQRDRRIRTFIRSPAALAPDALPEAAAQAGSARYAGENNVLWGTDDLVRPRRRIRSRHSARSRSPKPRARTGIGDHAGAAGEDPRAERREGVFASAEEVKKVHAARRDRGERLAYRDNAQPLS